MRTYVEERRPAQIGDAEWAALAALAAPISEGYLRRLVRELGLPMAPLVEGVRQESFEALERTLLALREEYAAAVQAGDRPRAKTIRRAVIGAKDHARFAAARLEGEARAVRDEMILWMLTWLENPAVFPTWLELRKRAE